MDLPVFKGTGSTMRVDEALASARLDFPRWLRAWGIFFLVILVWKWEFITRPPFEDQAIGAWSEALFLAESGFDYIRLRYEEPNFMEGGGYRSYMISIQPTVIALGLRFLGPSITIVLMHLAMFSLAATLALQIISLLRPRTGTLSATMVAIALLTAPALAAPIETVGMELPLLVTIMAATQANIRGRYVLATLFGFLAFLCKASGLISLLANVAFLGCCLMLAILGFLRLARFRIWWMVAGLAGNGLGILVALFLIQWSGDPVVSLPAYGWPAIMSLSYLPLWCPDIALLAYLAALGTIVSIARMIEQAQSSSITNRLEFFAHHFWQESGAVYVWIVISGFTLAIARYYFLIRYFLPVVVLIYVMLGWLFLGGTRIRRWGFVGIVALIAFNLSNQRGEWYFSIPEIGREVFRATHFWNARMGAFSERSGEYRKDHEATMALIRALNHLPRSTPIFCERNLSIYLRHRCLGYLSEPFERVSTVETMRFEDVVDRFRDSVQRSEAEGDPIVIWSRMSSTRVPPPDVSDTILFEDQGNPQVIAYRLNSSRYPKESRLLVDEYLRSTWSPDHAIERLQERFEYYKRSGRDRELLPIARETLETMPVDDFRRDSLREAERSLSRSLASSDQSGEE